MISALLDDQLERVERAPGLAGPRISAGEMIVHRIAVIADPVKKGVGLVDPAQVHQAT